MKRWIVLGLVGWQLLLTLFLTLAGLENRLVGAMACMLWGLDLIWIGGAGFLSLWGRDRARALSRRLPGRPGLKFFLFMALLALVEEAIATSMTNCTPLFGVASGEVYITASANYLDVVLLHSVVVFLPQFAVWAWLLGRYRFSPFEVFVLFGLTGLVNETLFAGPQLLAVAQWLLIYGLMAYLPAYCYPDLAGRRAVRWWHYPMAVLLTILASLPMVALLLLVIVPGHPSIHFPPIGAH